MRKFLVLGLFVAANAFAIPIITVTPTFGPDFGFNVQSPNFDAWAANAMTALINGQTSAGSGVTGYTAVANGANIAGNEFIATPFTSWKGTACPACGAGYTSEYGTAMYFSVSISTLGSPEAFTLSQLSVSEIYLGQSSGYGAGFLTNFGARVVGRDANGTLYNSAQALPNNILLKQLWYVGVGFVQGLDPNATGTNQEQIDATLFAIRNLADRTTRVCYSLPQSDSPTLIYHPTTSCASVNVPNNNPVPEPGAMFLLGGGLAALAIFRRRSA